VEIFSSLVYLEVDEVESWSMSWCMDFGRRGRRWLGRARLLI
jgi:hypothetical protein